MRAQFQGDGGSRDVEGLVVVVNKVTAVVLEQEFVTRVACMEFVAVVSLQLSEQEFVAVVAFITRTRLLAVSLSNSRSSRHLHGNINTLHSRIEELVQLQRP
jgi:hypothetical protein